MSAYLYCRPKLWNALAWLACAAFLPAVSVPAMAQAPRGSTDSAIVLDRVVAVVNNQAILASDIDEEIRLSVLDPAQTDLERLTSARALENLIGRALIQQQIRAEDAQAAEPSEREVSERLAQIRNELPACVRANCKSDAGWQAFLLAHGLSEEWVRKSARGRIEILRFIEQRFRMGIRIAPEEIETYYRETLLPQYPAGAPAPRLEEVAPRIEEILLQRQVNLLFDDWLKSLRRQGDIEVLEPALESPGTRDEPGSGKAGSQ